MSIHGKVDRDLIASLDVSTADYNSHDSSPGDVFASRIARHYGGDQSFLIVIHLLTGRPQACDLDYRLASQTEAGSVGQGQKVETSCCNILSENAWRYGEAIGLQLV
jgi:hypothetical protein